MESSNNKYLDILKKGVPTWNKWRDDNPRIIPDLSNITFSLEFQDLRGVNFCNTILTDSMLGLVDLRKGNFSNSTLIKTKFVGSRLDNAVFLNAELIDADLSSANMPSADFSNANLTRSYLSRTYSRGACFKGAILIGANLSHADLPKAIFRNAILNDADLSYAKLENTDFTKAKLINACLERAILIDTIFTNANLSGCRVYGISVWDLKTENAIQNDLIITPSKYFNAITVDNLEVAQFIYLLMKNEKIRNVIETIISKVVLILGRFSEERIKNLALIKDELRARNYLPVLFDFKRPDSRNITETVMILARLSRFVVVDLTDPKCVPQELSHVVETSPSIPILPIIEKGNEIYSMFEHFMQYPWVISIYEYNNKEDLQSSIPRLIESAEKKINELRRKLNESKDKSLGEEIKS